MQHGILTYLNEAAQGDMRSLLNDIGMNYDTIPFRNLARHRALKDS